MADLIFRVSPNIILGSFTSTRIGQFAKDYGSRFMVIVDPDLKSTGISLKILNSLDERKIDYFVFNELSGPANSKTIETALNLARDSHAEGIIALGGEKSINCGRAVAALFYSDQPIHDIIDSETQTVTGPALPFLALLTTNRDQFVFTSRVPVVDSRSKKIKLLKCQNDLCKMTIFDSNVYESLKPIQRAAMEIETLCLCVEAFSSQRASFFSDMLVEKSAEIFSNLLAGPNDELLSQAGCMASLALGAASTGVASLLALAINARYGTSRSKVAAILLPHIIEDVKKFKSDRIEKLEKLLNVENLSETVKTKTQAAGLPTELKALGLTIEQLTLAAEDASELDIMNNLARSMTADDLFELIKVAF